MKPVSLSHALEYQMNGIVLDTVNGKMTIDLTEPRTVIIQGENPKTHKSKLYMLRVTNAGGLVLQ